MRGLVGASTAAVALAVPTAADAASAPDPLRIMVLGDSVSQGSAGDWTWRYRLWEHLVTAEVAVDFVGPREDLAGLGVGSAASLAYADPDFDRDHAARWGMMAAAPDVPVDELVRDHAPDVVVSMLGVNDLLYGASPEGVARRTAAIVDEARSAVPTVDVVLAEATQTWFAGVAEYDALLPVIAAELSSDASRVVVAETAAGYEADRDTWDNSHPNARGEVKIAAAVADSLSALGVGPPPGPFPPVEVGPRVPAVLVGAAGEQRATLTWANGPGHTAQVVWGRDATLDHAWTRIPWVQQDSTWTAYSLTAGHTYEYRLQPVKGDDPPEGEVYSNIVRVTPWGPEPESEPPPTPTVTDPGPRPPPVRGLRARAGRSCVVLAWRPAVSAARFEVAVRRGGHWRRAGTTRGRRFVVRTLPRSGRWRIRVVAWRNGVRSRSAVVTVRRAPRGAPCR